jgi:hypothetical protein
LPGLRARLTGLRQNAFKTAPIVAVRERITQIFNILRTLKSC